MRTPKERAAQGLPEEGLKKRPGPKPKAKQPSALAQQLNEFSTDGDLVDIWERRMLNPSVKPATPIRLNTPGMHLRWINLANNGRYQRARYEEGWVPVNREELKDEREIYGVSFTTEGWVCRGEKQQEMLMKIPEAVHKKIQMAKAQEVEKSRRTIKENMQAAGAQHFGDKYNANRGEEIASSLSNFKGNVQFGTERVEPDDEDLERAQQGLEG
jgi:hypothetical protein